MGKITGFLEIDRFERRYAPAAERIRNYKEFTLPIPEEALRQQGARCMDCGIPFCHNGCPVNNQIPDWNDLVYRGDWEEAARNLHSTNNFPEFTGRICPAPCEAACTLNINDASVTIKTIECSIVDRAWAEGWVKPERYGKDTGKTVAVIGSGPAGMACAQQLARAGHAVTSTRSSGKPGGLLRYGIPDFKMEKHLIDRRVAQMEAEGVVFRHCNVNVGIDVTGEELVAKYDAVVLSGGAEKPRDLPIPGRELHGVHFAMDFLPQQNRRVSHEVVLSNDAILATGKHVVVIGGGDTGSDCIGTSIRQGALSVTQLEIMPEPPVKENKMLTWPDWPLKLRTSSSHQEGRQPRLRRADQAFQRRQGRQRQGAALRARRRQDAGAGGAPHFELPRPISCCWRWASSRRSRRALLMGLGVALDKRGNVVADQKSYTSSIDKVWACGDMRRGQSLVVWAIREGRQAAHAVDKALMGETVLPR